MGCRMGSMGGRRVWVGTWRDGGLDRRKEGRHKPAKGQIGQWQDQASAGETVALTAKRARAAEAESRGAQRGP